MFGNLKCVFTGQIMNAKGIKYSSKTKIAIKPHTVPKVFDSSAPGEDVEYKPR